MAGDEQRWTSDIGAAVADFGRGQATLLERRLRPAGVGDTTLAAEHLTPHPTVPSTMVLPIADPLAVDATATFDHTSGAATILRLAARLATATQERAVVVTLARIRNEASLLIGTVTIPPYALESVATADALAATDVGAGDWWLATCTQVGEDAHPGTGLVLAVELSVAVLLGDG